MVLVSCVNLLVSSVVFFCRSCCIERRRCWTVSVTWPWCTISCPASHRTCRTRLWSAAREICSFSSLRLSWPESAVSSESISLALKAFLTATNVSHTILSVQNRRLHLQRLWAGVDAAAPGHGSPAETDGAAEAHGGPAQHRSSRAEHGTALHEAGGHGLDRGVGGRSFSRGKLCPGMGS